jgi:hypothetical protein
VLPTYKELIIFFFFLNFPSILPSPNFVGCVTLIFYFCSNKSVKLTLVFFRIFYFKVFKKFKKSNFTDRFTKTGPISPVFQSCARTAAAPASKQNHERTRDTSATDSLTTHRSSSGSHTRSFVLPLSSRVATSPTTAACMVLGTEATSPIP